jgi:hypothetical protein
MSIKTFNNYNDLSFSDQDTFLNNFIPTFKLWLSDNPKKSPSDILITYKNVTYKNLLIILNSIIVNDFQNTMSNSTLSQQEKNIQYSQILTNILNYLSPSIPPSVAPSFDYVSPSIPPSFEYNIQPNIPPSFEYNIQPSIPPTFDYVSPSIPPSFELNFAPSIPPSFDYVSPNFAPSIPPSISQYWTPSITPSISSNISSSITPNISFNIPPTIPPTISSIQTRIPPSINNNLLTFNLKISLINNLNKNDTYLNYTNLLNLSDLIDGILKINGCIYNNNNSRIFENKKNILINFNTNPKFIGLYAILSNPYYNKEYNPEITYVNNFTLSVDKINPLSTTIQYNNINIFNPTIELYDDISDTNKIVFSINPFTLKPLYSLTSQFIINDNNNKWNNILESFNLTLLCINNIFQCKLTDSINLRNFNSTKPLTLSYNNIVINTFKLLNNGNYVVDSSSIQVNPKITYILPTITLTNITLSSPDISSPLLFNNITITPQYTELFENIKENFNLNTPSSILLSSIRKSFNPITPYPIVTNINLNIFKLYQLNIIKVQLSDISISNYDQSKKIVTITGSVYFPYDITIPINPYFYCNLFSFQITNISVTDKKYFPIDPLNPNYYYIRLSINQQIKLKNPISILKQIRIYLSPITTEIIINPNLLNTIMYIDHQFVTTKPLIFDRLSTPLSSYIAKYNLNFPERIKIISETFTGFDIFGQFNIVTVNEFPNNSNDIYKILYTSDPNICLHSPYNINIWSERFVTPMLSDTSLNNQSVQNMHNELITSNFYSFKDDLTILSAPYRHSSIHYQYIYEPNIIYSIIKNGFNPKDTINSILDYNANTILQMKMNKIKRTELNDIQTYVGILYCNISIINELLNSVSTWPKNSFEFNIAFFSYITYKMYNILDKTEPINISKKETDSHMIKIYKITTPFRKNTPFIYRIDIKSFLYYISNQTISQKLLKYTTQTSTISIDLPTALILAYYDKNPQSISDSTNNLSSQALLTSYCNNQSILNKSLPIIPVKSLLNIPNVIENFKNKNKYERVNSINLKYALLQ